MRKWDLPDGWEWRILKDTVSIIMGQSPPGDSYNESGEGTPFLQGNAEFGEKNPLHIKYSTAPKKIAPENSVLISVRAPVGDVNIAQRDYCIGRGLASLKSADIDSDFLYYYFKSRRKEVEDIGSGSTFKAITKKTLENIVIPIPPLETQRKIVAILDKAEEIKRLRAEANAQTQRLIQSVFLDMFGDPIHNNKSWNKAPIGSLTQTNPTKGSTPTTYGHSWEKEGVLFLRSECITQDAVNLQGSRHISDNAHNSMSRSKVYPNDILIRITGDVGIACMFPSELIEANINQHIAIIRLKEKYDLEHEFLIGQLNLECFRNYFFNITRGVTHPHLSLKQIRETMVITPPIELQKKFTAKVQLIRETIRFQNLEEDCVPLQNIILNKALKGELIT